MTVDQPIVIIGGVGTGDIILQAIRDLQKSGIAIECIGFLNDRVPKTADIAGLPVLGSFESWRDLPANVGFISAMHMPKEALKRSARLAALDIPSNRFAQVFHPTASIADNCVIGPGTYVGPGAVIMPGARVGAHVSLRAGCYISHDVYVGDFVFVGPNATVSGRATIGEGAHIGPNAVVRDDVSVGRFSVVGIGSAVVRDVEDLTVVMGVPARRIERLNPWPE